MASRFIHKLENLDKKEYIGMYIHIATSSHIYSQVFIKLA